MTKKSATPVSERAALYALGMLSEEEADAFEAELAGGDAQAQSEVDAFRAVVGDLAHAAPPQAPPAALRERVLARLAADDAPAFERDGLSFVRSERLGWQPGSVAGVDVKPLAIDAARHRRTVLVRMAPGTTYPAHRHGDLEEIYLLEGDYLVAGVLMHAGDYCRAEAGTVHETSRTVSGCVLLVTASLRDQRIA
jgi:anti-sigma factor ChrR (cupin superfamily)